MANDLNQCNFTGRLGKDPEVRQVGNDSVANFTLAVGEQWKDKQSGERKERTTWVNVVIWGKLADVVKQYATKGMLVRITGKLQVRQWDKDGVAQYSTEIVASEFQMLSSKSDGQNHGGQHQGGNNRPVQQPQQQRQQPAPQPQGGAPAYDDDIPF
ncbi:single strand DNA binding protein [Aeromonas phage ST4]|nr:single strand DNA binding protein [Aeromonas phage ST4]